MQILDFFKNLFRRTERPKKKRRAEHPQYEQKTPNKILELETLIKTLENDKRALKRQIEGLEMENKNLLWYKNRVDEQNQLIEHLKDQMEEYEEKSNYKKKEALIKFTKAENLKNGRPDKMEIMREDIFGDKIITTVLTPYTLADTKCSKKTLQKQIKKELDEIIAPKEYKINKFTMELDRITVTLKTKESIYK